MPSAGPASLIEAGSVPFHLNALITERGDPDSKTEVEIYWVSPNLWRRTIKSQTEFSQTLIVNGDQVFEEDSDDYFPLWSQTLTRALVDPAAVRDILNANTYGRSLRLTDYEDFNGRSIARTLIYVVDPGDSYKAKVTELTELRNPDSKLFSIANKTPTDEQIRSVYLPEPELNASAVDKHEIIWPQALDGAETGAASFFVSVDRSGQVREVTPLRTANERTNDSARRQIMRWRFSQVVKDGASVQAEAVLNFELNTRARGPSQPLTNDEARKLATDIVEPQIPYGIVPSGTIFSCRVAVDSDGQVIEIIASGSVPGFSTPCYGISKWHFRPIMEDGEPRPFRALITFQAP